MPWEPSDAIRFTKKADTQELKEIWAHVANGVLKETGDEGEAVTRANGVVAERHDAPKKGK